MRTPCFRSNGAALAALFSVGFLVGCAASHEHRNEALSSQEFRVLYPREYYDSLDPLDQREVDRRMTRDQWRNEGK